MAKAATKRVKVTANCGGTNVAERVKPKHGRWTAILTLHSRCAAAHRAKVTGTYPGGPEVRRAVVARRVTRGG